jgi:hypothetical protein
VYPENNRLVVLHSLPQWQIKKLIQEQGDTTTTTLKGACVPKMRFDFCIVLQWSANLPDRIQDTQWNLSQ